jgi:outer membrane lipoprotein SlyB
MRGKFVLSLVLPLALAAVLGACATNGVKPGFVQTANSVTPPPGSSGRVVSINDVSLQGSGGSGSGRGPLVGGLLGGAGGAAIGAGTSGTLAGGLIGGVLGAVGGAIAGSVVDSHGGMGGGRGIQVTVQSDDGQTAVVAQRDDGDIQLGDRVQIIEGPGGVPKVVRENPRAPDYRQNGGSPYAGGSYGNGPSAGGQYGGNQYGGNQYGYGPPPGHGPVSQDYAPLPGGYGQTRSYPPPQDYRQSQGSYSSPQDDPRYGSLN